MGKVTQARGHVSADELAARIDRCKDGWHTRKLLVIWTPQLIRDPLRRLQFTVESLHRRSTIGFPDITVLASMPYVVLAREGEETN